MIIFILNVISSDPGVFCILSHLKRNLTKTTLITRTGNYLVVLIRKSSNENTLFKMQRTSSLPFGPVKDVEQVNTF